MLTTLIVCLCLTTTLRADSLEFSSSSASTSAPNTPQRIAEAFCDNDAELAKISCMSTRDHEDLWGGMLKHGFARIINVLLIKYSLMLIGKEELRKTLNLPPPKPWAPYNYTKPSKEEIASAQTLEAYYDLKEPRQKAHSLDSFYFYEHNFPLAIAFLDKRVPVIRSVFRCKFEKIRSIDVAEVTDREKVDRMIAELIKFTLKADRATLPMLSATCLEE